MKPGTRLTSEMVVCWLLFAFVIALYLAPILNEGILWLDGHTGTIEHDDLWTQMDPISHILYWLGDFGCHQQTERSIIIGGSQMPLCIRETMMLSGVVVGLSLSIIFNIGYCRRILIASMAVSGVTFIEWALKAVSGIDIIAITSATGMISGMAMGLFVHELVQMANESASRRYTITRLESN